MYVGPVHFVKQTGLELVTLDLILGLWPAATHSTHQPLKYRRESDLSATSSPPHVPVRSALQHSHLSTALTHSSTTARAPTLTQWERRRRLRTQRPHYSDGKEWYITSASKPRKRYIARFFPEKGHGIRGEHLGVNVVVNHEGLRTETGAWKEPAGGPVETDPVKSKVFWLLLFHKFQAVKRPSLALNDLLSLITNK